MREEPGVVHDAALQFGHMTGEVGDEAQIPLPGASPPYAVPFRFERFFFNHAKFHVTAKQSPKQGPSD